LPAVLNSSIITVHGDPTIPMVLVSNVAQVKLARPNFLFAWDHTLGKIVWYYSNLYHYKLGQGYDVRSDNDIVLYALDGLLRISPQGEIKNNVTTDGCPDFHHEAYLENDNTVWALNIEILDEGYPAVPADVGDTLVRWKINSGDVSVMAKTSNFVSRDNRFPPESNLVAFTYIPCKNRSIPQSNTRDWTHGNSLTVSGDGNYLVFSARSLSSVYLLDKETYELKYTIGGAFSDFDFGADANFSSQHSVFLLNQNRLLLFDNGVYNTERVSRGLLLRLNFNTMEATKIWDYHVSLNTSCFSQFTGSARKYIDENDVVKYLINFPTCNWNFAGKSGLSYVAELDENGNELGLYVYNVADSSFNYRARPYDTIIGEYYPYN